MCVDTYKLVFLRLLTLTKLQFMLCVFSYNWEPAGRHRWRGSHTGSEPEDRPDAQITTSTLHPQTKGRRKRQTYVRHRIIPDDQCVCVSVCVCGWSFVPACAYTCVDQRLSCLSEGSLMSCSAQALVTLVKARLRFSKFPKEPELNRRARSASWPMFRNGKVIIFSWTV